MTQKRRIRLTNQCYVLHQLFFFHSWSVLSFRSSKKNAWLGWFISNNDLWWRFDLWRRILSRSIAIKWLLSDLQIIIRHICYNWSIRHLKLFAFQHHRQDIELWFNFQWRIWLRQKINWLRLKLSCTHRMSSRIKRIGSHWSSEFFVVFNIHWANKHQPFWTLIC